MIKINFICHGNICRSTMAESVMRELVKKANVDELFQISSSATSREEIGNSIHWGTIEVLKKNNIPIIPHRAIQITKEAANDCDLLICMDNNNIHNLKKIISSYDYHKISLLLEYANLNRDIKDPWYTGNFDETFSDVLLGCQCLLKSLIK